MKKVENAKTTVPPKPLPPTPERDSQTKSETLFAALCEMALEPEGKKSEEIEHPPTEATRDIIKKYRSSKKRLIAKLETVDHPVAQGLIKHLSSKKIQEDLSEKKLREHLLNYTKKLIYSTKTYQNSPTNGDLTPLNHHEDIEKLKFALSAFDFDADTVMTQGDENGYTLLMLTCVNSKHFHLLKYLVNKLRTDSPKASNIQETINETIHSGPLRGRTALHLACRNGNVMGVEFLLSNGANPNAGKITPLGDALTEEQHEVAECLLNNSSIDANQYSDGTHPLLLAAQHAKARIIIKLIAVKKVDPNLKGHNKESILHTLLMRPVNQEDRDDRNAAIKFLLKSKLFELDLNTPYQDQTLVFIASRMGHSLAVNLLLEKGADPHTLVKRGTYQGHNAISIAVSEGQVDIVKQFTVEANNAKIAKLDFETPFTTKQLQTPLKLMEIAEYYQLESNTPDRERIISILQVHWIATNPGQVITHINRLIKADRDEILISWEHFLLSDQCIDPTTGNTPLHIASKYGKTKSLTVLIDFINVSIDAKNKHGDTALHLACGKRNINTVEFLLNSGCNINLRNEDQETPFDVASRKNNEACLRLLLNKRFTMTTKPPCIEDAISTKRDALAKILLEKISAKEHRDRILRLLKQSATIDNIIIFTLLAEKTISFNPREIATLYILSTLENEELFKLLLSIYGKYLEKQDMATLINTPLNQMNGNTVLHEICNIGNQHCISSLTNLGGDLSRTNKMGETPLDLIKNTETKKLFTRPVKQVISELPKHNTIKHKPTAAKAEETSQSQKTIEIQQRLAAKKLAAKNRQEKKPKKPSTSPAITTSKKQPAASPKAITNKTIPAKITPSEMMSSPLAATSPITAFSPKALLKTKVPLSDPTDLSSYLSSDSQDESNTPPTDLLDESKASPPDSQDESNTLSPDPRDESIHSAPDPQDESNTSSPDPHHESITPTSESSDEIEPIIDIMELIAYPGDKTVPRIPGAINQTKAPSPETLEENPTHIDTTFKVSKVSSSGIFCTFFCATPNDINPYVDPLPAVYQSEIDTPLANLTKNIERLLLSLKSSDFISEDKAILVILADLHDSLNYFAAIEEISEKSPMLILLKKLTLVIKTYGLVSLYNLEKWKNAALMTYENIKNISGNFHLDYPEINGKAGDHPISIATPQLDEHTVEESLIGMLGL